MTMIDDLTATTRTAAGLLLTDLDAIDRALRSPGAMTPRHLGEIIVLLDKVAGTIKDVRAGAARQLADIQGEGGRVALPSGEVVSIGRTAGPTRVEAPKLLAQIAARCADLAYDRETGEKVPPAEFAKLVVDKVALLSGIDNASHKGWRSKELTAEGLSLGDYQTKELGTLKAEVK